MRQAGKRGLMASYRFSAKIVSRGNGQNVVAKAAYNAREDLRDERTDEMKRHSQRPGIEWKGIFAPKDAPEWAKDRAQLWNAVERREDQQPNKKNRAEAQLARSLELNFPHELDADQRRQLVRDFVREQFVRRGMVADVAIHAPDEHSDERNYHAHILLTLRELKPDGFGAKVREWNSRELHADLREKWAELGARYLEKIPGCELEAERYKVAHLTLERQSRAALERGDTAYAETLKREPTVHLGPAAFAMERNGQQTDRGNIYRDTEQRDQTAAELKAELAEIQKAIAEYERQAAKENIFADIGTPIDKTEADRILAAIRSQPTRENPFADLGTPVSAREADRVRSEVRRQNEAEAQPAPTRENPFADLGTPVSAREADRVRSEARKQNEAEAQAAPTRENPFADLGTPVSAREADRVRSEARKQNEAEAQAAPTRENPFADLGTPVSAREAHRLRSEIRRQNDPERQDAHPEVSDGARAQAPDRRPTAAPERGTAAEKIWLAFHRSDNAKAFAAALNQSGLVLAEVTKEEAERSRLDAAEAKDKGLFAPIYREGEIVAVDDRSYVYKLNERTTGSYFNDTQRYLRNGLDRSTLRGIDDTRQMMHNRATFTKGVVKDAVSIGRSAARGVKGVIGKGMGLAAGIGGIAHTFADAFSSLFAPQAPLTPQQIAENERLAPLFEKEANDAAAAHDWRNYTDRYEQVAAKRAEEAREAQQRGDQYQRLQHDRDKGRERER
jgi:MobA/MobL family